MKAWSEEAKGQMQGRRPASGAAASSAVERRGDGTGLGRLSLTPSLRVTRRPSRDAAAALRPPTIDPRAELSARAAQTPAHMSTLEAILARMTARPTEKDVAEAERLQKVMAGAD